MRRQMEKFCGIVKRLSREMDKLAGYCVVGVMLLVVMNIILRKVFKQPIPGTYEIIGYLTALAISLALAYCAVQNAHIGVDYIINKFPKPIRTASATFINLVSMCFWGCAAWQVGRYAQSLMKTGVVSSTAQIPVYPVVFLIGLGLLALCLVSAVKLYEGMVQKSRLIAEVKEGN